MTEKLFLIVLGLCLAGVAFLAPEADPGPFAEAIREMNRE